MELRKHSVYILHGYTLCIMQTYAHFRTPYDPDRQTKKQILCIGRHKKVLQTYIANIIQHMPETKKTSKWPMCESHLITHRHLPHFADHLVS